MASGRRELHRRFLPEPCVNVSGHTAPITRASLLQPMEDIKKAVERLERFVARHGGAAS